MKLGALRTTAAMGLEMMMMTSEWKHQRQIQIQICTLACAFTLQSQL
jgi:hypothetical protein